MLCKGVIANGVYLKGKLCVICIRHFWIIVSFMQEQTWYVSVRQYFQVQHWLVVVQVHNELKCIFLCENIIRRHFDLDNTCC